MIHATPPVADIRAAVQLACERGREYCPQGRVASYIPELARADPTLFGLAVCTREGQVVSEGDADHLFTLQSASKVFSLSAVVAHSGDAVFEKMSVEPSGDTFFSIVKLEEEHGEPRNPYINAGAILTSSYLPGETSVDKITAFRGFLGQASGLGPGAFAVDHAVYSSEAETGHRNRALAEIMRHHNVISDVEMAVETYFTQCAVTCTASSLARSALYLCNGGVDPVTGKRLITPASNRGIVALMMTSGMYDEVGSHAIEVGLPSKSSVSGAVLAVVPGVMTIAGFGPALGPKGNSIGAMKAMEVLSEKLGLSVFG